MTNAHWQPGHNRRPIQPTTTRTVEYKRRARAALALLVAIGTASWVSSVQAETQAEIAARENEEGKALMFKGNYREASEKFRTAANRVRDPKYYFNLCKSTYQQGIFGEALVACQSAGKLSADPEFKARVAQMETKIRTDAAAQRVPLAPEVDSATPPSGSATGSGAAATGVGSPTGSDPGGESGVAGGSNAGGSSTTGTPGGSPNNPGPPITGPSASAGPRYAVGRPSENFAAAKPQHQYSWSIGADLFGGRGAIGRADAYGNTVVGLRLKADHLLQQTAKFGSQIYFQASGFGTGNGTTQSGGRTEQSLQIVDIGGAVYKHFCGTMRVCVTPLGGVQFALMNPGNNSTGSGSQLFNYVGFGARLEVAASYAFGSRYEHVLSLGLNLNAYTKVLSEPMNGLSAQIWGLDRGGTTGSLGLGYTYRFTSMRSPFLSLE